MSRGARVFVACLTRGSRVLFLFPISLFLFPISLFPVLGVAWLTRGSRVGVASDGGFGSSLCGSRKLIH